MISKKNEKHITKCDDVLDFGKKTTHWCLMSHSDIDFQCIILILQGPSQSEVEI